MPPFQQAQAVYDREPCARPFVEDLFLHLQHGHVYSSPTAFMMFRPVDSSWSYQRLASPWETDPAGDAWMVWLLAGDCLEAMAQTPYPKPWMIFERGNQPRKRPFAKVCQKLRAQALQRTGTGTDKGG